MCVWGVTALQDYFTHIVPSQSVGGAKTGDPRENHKTTRKQNLACLTCDPSGEMTSDLERERLAVSDFTNKINAGKGKQIHMVIWQKILKNQLSKSLL